MKTKWIEITATIRKEYLVEVEDTGEDEDVLADIACDKIEDTSLDAIDSYEHHATYYIRPVSRFYDEVIKLDGTFEVN